MASAGRRTSGTFEIFYSGADYEGGGAIVLDEEMAKKVKE